MPAGGEAGRALLAKLHELDRRCALRGRQLIAEIARQRPHQAVLFRIGPRRMLVALDGISEVLDLPRTITPLPGVARWVIGIANHRGELLPLFDLRALLFGVRESRPPVGRVLVPRGCLRSFGLLVDEVIGIRGYEQLDRGEHRGDHDGPVAKIICGIFRDETSVLPVVDLAAVETLPSFAASAAPARMQST